MTKIRATVDDTRKGDIVRFSKYALRVEAPPQRQGNFIQLHGRISADGCPLVTRKFMTGLPVTIERNAESA